MRPSHVGPARSLANNMQPCRTGRIPTPNCNPQWKILITAYKFQPIQKKKKRRCFSVRNQIQITWLRYQLSACISVGLGASRAAHELRNKSLRNKRHIHVNDFTFYSQLATSISWRELCCDHCSAAVPTFAGFCPLNTRTSRHTVVIAPWKPAGRPVFAPWKPAGRPVFSLRRK